MNLHHIPRAQLIAAAESYAGVSPFADACYRYYFYQDKTARARLSACLVVEFAEHLTALPTKYHQPVIDATLTELSYPAKPNTQRTFPVKERACCVGVSRRQYYRLPFDTAIDDIINHITAIAKGVAGKVQMQLGKKFDAGY